MKSPCNKAGRREAIEMRDAMQKERIFPNVGIAGVAAWDVGDPEQRVRSIKSAERTLALFELFSYHQRPLTVGEISKMLGIPQPSVSMLMRNLTKLGYIEHDWATRRYMPTIRIMLLGSWIHRRFSRDHDIERQLDELLETIGETVVIAIQNGVYSQYVSARLPKSPTRLEVQSGLLRPITCTAGGRALLSLKPNSEVSALAHRCNAEVTEERLRVRQADFIDVIEQVRVQGYATTAGDMTPGFGAIAVAIPSPVGQIPMALSVGAPSDRIEAKRDLILRSLFDFRSRYDPAAG